MSATITRSIVTARAYGLYAVLTEDGNAKVEKTDYVEFLSTNPTQVEGMRALKENGIKVQSKDVRIEVVKEEVYAMTLDKFIECAKVVERAKGGYIRKSDLADDAEVEEA